MTRVLLAEDDDDHLFFSVRAIQEEHGADVQVATVRDGEEALDYLHRRGSYHDAVRPDLVVLDLKMPRRNGLEVLSEVKATAALRSIPVVVFSSSDRPEDVRRSYDYGANSYVTKSASLTGLREGVRALSRYWLDTNQRPPG